MYIILYKTVYSSIHLKLSNSYNNSFVITSLNNSEITCIHDI